ncbi:unnamed protein product [Urochloa humidicola]
MVSAWEGGGTARQRMSGRPAAHCGRHLELRGSMAVKLPYLPRGAPLHLPRDAAEQRTGRPLLSGRSHRGGESAFCKNRESPRRHRPHSADRNLAIFYSIRSSGGSDSSETGWLVFRLQQVRDHGCQEQATARQARAVPARRAPPRRRHPAASGPEPWLRDRANLSRLFVARDSAGGNIAHNMAMRAGRTAEGLDGGAAAIRGLLLLDPYFWGKEPVAPVPARPRREGVREEGLDGTVEEKVAEGSQVRRREKFRGFT